MEWVVSEGHLNLHRVDEYQLVDPGPRSKRSFAEFMATAGPRASLLPVIYAALGLPEPDSSKPIHTGEEERIERFIDGWRLAPSDDTLIRAARLVAEGTRMATLGWVDLIDEQIAAPARELLHRGEVGRFPDQVRDTFAKLLSLLPEMFEWLFQRYLEQRSVSGIVDGFEEFFAARGLHPSPPPTVPPAVVFVDLSGYTRLTEERGDEAAVDLTSTLQREAESVAVANNGRVVKLLGDGAMLRFPDAERGLRSALALVQNLSDGGSLTAHAGVHTGPVIERDLDLFGRTVNLASRVAGAAGPGEVLATEEVVESVDDPTLRLERVEDAVMKGIAEPVKVFRVVGNETSRAAKR